jgi:hypothetical protein
MERVRFLIWIAWLLEPAGALAGGDETLPREGDAAANAALRYFRAYAALQQSRPAAIDMVALLEKCQTVALDTRAQEFVNAAEEAMRELHHGAALPQCVWALSVEDGITADTSHRGVARTLTALAVLRARLLFQGGQPTEAVDDLLAAMTLTRHSGVTAHRTHHGARPCVSAGPPLAPLDACTFDPTPCPA